MTALAWDLTGDRLYQTGVDRGVLYFPDVPGVAWNGLTSIDESSDVENKASYADGIKYLQTQVPGDFSATIKAFTYPEEFEKAIGILSDSYGMQLHNQKATSFGLSYRTLIGNDVSGIDHGYMIHLAYNLLATPDSIAYGTLTDSPEAIEFSWGVSGLPVEIPGFKPTAHITINSTKLDPETLTSIEDVLYGTDVTDPYLPTPLELFGLVSIVITDHGDGTWSAHGPSHFISMLDSTTFEIIEANATYSDADTYSISTSVT